MADPESFFRWVTPYVPTCPDPIVASHIIDAARSFCEATRCWRYITSTTLDGTEPDVSIDAEDAQVHELEGASFNGQPLIAVAYDPLLSANEGLPSSISQINSGSFTLFPGIRAGTLVLSAFLKPSVNAMTIPDFLLGDHGQTIGYGALATLLAIPDQPFSNPVLAGYYVSEFQSRKDAGFRLNRRGQQRAPARTRGTTAAATRTPSNTTSPSSRTRSSPAFCRRCPSSRRRYGSVRPRRSNRAWRMLVPCSTKRGCSPQENSREAG